MPIYEYYCEDCKRLSSFLLLRTTEEIEPYCKGCGSKGVKRIVSLVSIPRSEEKRMGGLLDPSKFSDLDENDPRSIEQIMRRVSGELGDELGEGLEGSIEEALDEQQSTAEEGV
jgi:putative FmdB family regulatory protein